MTQPNAQPDPELELDCECGYRCRGATEAERLLDAQRHARDAHGIDVTPEQVKTTGNRTPNSYPRGR